jgi:hypothetical protein
MSTRPRAALAKALADPAKDKLVEQGIVAVGGTSEEFRAFHHRLHHRHRHHRRL